MPPKLTALLLASLTAACTGGAGDSPDTERAERVGSATAEARTTAGDRRGVVLFLGTSLTAGYGVGADIAYPARIQAMIDSAGLPFRVINGGISGETSAGGLARIDWMLQHPVEVLVLELGANDGLRGYDVDAMRANLDAILRQTREQYPRAALVIAGMEAPPNLGRAYTTRFRDTFRELADAYGAAYIPFLLEGVAAEPALNIDDGIHPNADGHRALAETVWRVVEPVLRARATG